MMKLTRKRRIQIPNALAVLAAVLLLVSSVTGFESRHEGQSADNEGMNSVQVESVDKQVINDTAAPKRRGLALGLLLFRR